MSVDSPSALVTVTFLASLSSPVTDASTTFVRFSVLRSGTVTSRAAMWPPATGYLSPG